MRALALLPLLALAGCGADPIGQGETGNADVSAAQIATIDGCRLWRVNDGYSYRVYMATCGPAQRADIQWEENCGKNCTNVLRTFTVGRHEPQAQ